MKEVFFWEHGMKMVDSGETTQTEAYRVKNMPAARGFFCKFPGG